VKKKNYQEQRLTLFHIPKARVIRFEENHEARAGDLAPLRAGCCINLAS